jgi:phage-related protein
MSITEVVFYAEDDGSAPALEWLDSLPEKVRDKFIVRVERLAECGSELRRPEADLLRDGIYELRARHMHVNYRMLYFFCAGRAVLSHGLTKEDEVPFQDIERAVKRRVNFEASPDRHTYTEE